MHTKYMELAIKEAKKSLKTGDVPVGAVVVRKGKVIATTHNKKEKEKCVLFHAEILAIKIASKKIKDFRLSDCDIYITKEPCLMCMGALLSARIKTIYFGAFDKKYGTMQLAKDNNFNHKCECVGGILQDKCEELLSSFFKDIRSKKC